MNYFTLLIFSLNCLTILWIKIGIVEGIVGGDVARPGQFNYHVAIYNDNLYVCGGVLLTAQHVLTAAQCVISTDNLFINGAFWVIGGAGTIDPSLYTKSAEVEAMYVPREFQFPDIHGYRSTNPKLIKGDIAVLRLRNQMKGIENPKKNIFWGSESALAHEDVSIDHSEAVIAGYGHETVVNTKDSAGHNFIEYQSNAIRLKYAKTQFLTYAECKTTHKAVQNSHVCARVIQRNQRVPEGTCKFDEGSGLILHGKYLIGILVKPPVNCNESQAPGLYTKVSGYYKFITYALSDTRSNDIRVFHTRERRTQKPMDLVLKFSKLNI